MKDKWYSYGKQSITQAEVDAVVETVTGELITQGPRVHDFEAKIAEYTGAKHCVVVASGTAALHLAAIAADIGPGDEVITSPNTFVATPNSVLYVGGTVQFADIEPDTGNISPAEIEKAITEKTRAIIPVHFAGQSCDMEAISEIARKYDLKVIEDAAHAIGSDYLDTKVGSCKYSDMTIFSFHPVKTITTCEGGAITTNDTATFERLQALRIGGIYRDDACQEIWQYEMRELGFNYRMSEFQAALGMVQLSRLEGFKKRRREIVDYYNKHLGLPHLVEQDYSNACFHLYPVLVENRDEVYRQCIAANMGVQVHYIPVHTQPYYQQLGFEWGNFPNAEAYFQKTLSLPLHPLLEDDDLAEIVRRIKDIFK